jgi:predicted metal-dependent phosphotriesterase family hydrolase
VTIRTVTGPFDGEVRCAEAHGHLWIRAAEDAEPRIDDETSAAEELADFASAGGDLVIDCQPGETGRDGRVLRRLSAGTGVPVVASTGFHLQRYYPVNAGPWTTDAESAHRLFLDELCQGLAEASEIRAGVVKTAWTGEGGRERDLMRAALDASHLAGTAVVVHTESGAAIEDFVDLAAGSGLPPARIQLSHLDKRPDAGLHEELARAGFFLGYDTFLRPKYCPERHVWPLLRRMVAGGLWKHITIGLDLVDPLMWRVRGGPGLRTIAAIIGRLRDDGTPQDALTALGGGNVSRLLGGEA